MSTDTPVDPWGASLRGVTDLLPANAILETVPAGKYGVTVAMVYGYLEELSGKAAVRFAGWDRLVEARKAEFKKAVRDAVHNGAASYAQAARFPEQAAQVNRDGYAQTLWARYEAAMDELATALVQWLKDRDEATSDGDSGDTTAAYYFPDPIFTETTYF